MADFNKPDGSSLWTNFMTQVREARNAVAKMFDGGTGNSNIPVDSKRLDKSDGQVYNYNGGGWDSLGFLSSGETSSPTVGVSDTQTLTNKTLDADNNTFANIEVDNLKSDAVATSISSPGSDSKLATEKAVNDAIAANAGGGGVTIYLSDTSTGDGSGSSDTNRVGVTGFQAVLDTHIPSQHSSRLLVVIDSEILSNNVPLNTATYTDIDFYFSKNAAFFAMDGITMYNCTFTRDSRFTGAIRFILTNANNFYDCHLHNVELVQGVGYTGAFTNCNGLIEEVYGCRFINCNLVLRHVGNGSNDIIFSNCRVHAMLTSETGPSQANHGSVVTYTGVWVGLTVDADSKIISI